MTTDMTVTKDLKVRLWTWTYSTLASIAKLHICVSTRINMALFFTLFAAGPAIVANPKSF